MSSGTVTHLDNLFNLDAKVITDATFAEEGSRTEGLFPRR